MGLSDSTTEFLAEQTSVREKPRISTRNLRVFVACYESGSVTDAADSLFISQSAASRSLSSFEQKLDTTLFDRTAHGLQPTEAADEIFDACSKALEALDEAIAHIVNRREQRVLNVGVVHDLLTLTAPVVRDFAHDHSMGHLALHDANTLVNQVRVGTIDLALIASLREQLPADLVATPMRSMQFALFRPAEGYRADIVALPPEGTWERATLRALLGDLHPGPSFEAAGGATTKRLVREGFSAYLPLCCGEDLEDVQIVEPIFDIQVYAITRDALSNNPDADRFAQIFSATIDHET